MEVPQGSTVQGPSIPNKTRKADVSLRAVAHKERCVRCCAPNSPRQATTTGHNRRLGGPEDDQVVVVGKQPGKRFGQARNSRVARRVRSWAWRSWQRRRWLV